VPLFGICRGFQEMNVAFGGSVHPEIRELPGRVNHRMPRPETGEIHRSRETIRVNSLHGQGILDAGPRVVIEGVADDGTVEAIRIADGPGFALGVQWHAEYDRTAIR
jgi:putative glutamine amidotransferase